MNFWHVNKRLASKSRPHSLAGRGRSPVACNEMPNGDAPLVSGGDLAIRLGHRPVKHVDHLLNSSSKVQSVYTKTCASAPHGTRQESMVRDIGKKRGDEGVDCRDEEQVDDRAKLYPPRDSGRPKPHSESAIRETSDRRRVEGSTIGRAKQHR